MYNLWTDLKVNVAIGQSAGTAFIQEVNVFNEETEEGNHNLERRDYGKFNSTFFIWDIRLIHSGSFFFELSHLLLAAMGSLRPLGGATECSAVVTEVIWRIHLVLNEVRRDIDQTHTRMEKNHITTYNESFVLQFVCIYIYSMYLCFLTSRISNLSVLTLLQVFFSLATGLMFIPAVRQKQHEYSIYRTDLTDWVGWTVSSLY